MTSAVLPQQTAPPTTLEGPTEEGSPPPPQRRAALFSLTCAVVAPAAFYAVSELNTSINARFSGNLAAALTGATAWLVAVAPLALLGLFAGVFGGVVGLKSGIKDKTPWGRVALLAGLLNATFLTLYTLFATGFLAIDPVG